MDFLEPQWLSFVVDCNEKHKLYNVVGLAMHVFESASKLESSLGLLD